MSTFPQPARLLLKESWFPVKDVQKDPSESSPLLSGGHPAASFQIEKPSRIGGNPIYLTALTGPPTTDNHVMKEVILEAILY